MPYKSEKMKIANTKFDRRIKLTEEDKEQIIYEYKNGASIRALSRKFKVDRVLIKCVINPEEKQRRAEYSKKYCKEHRQSGEEWNATMKEHRQYKQKIYLENQKEGETK